MEKGEAVRHNLEFELTKSQREVSQVMHAAKEKETLMKDGTDDLKRKTMLNIQVCFILSFQF